MALRSAQLRIAMTAMELKSNAASHRLKMLQNSLASLEKEEKEAQRRQLHAIKRTNSDGSVSLLGMAQWHASAEKLMKSIKQRRKTILIELTGARNEATQCRMQLEAFKAILKKELEKELIKRRRSEQNQLPVPVRRLN